MKINITTKINVFVTLLVILPIVFIGWFFANYFKGSLEQELMKRGNSQVRSLAEQSEYGVLVGSRDELQRIAGSFMKETDVVGIEIVDLHNRTLVSEGKREGDDIKLFKWNINTVNQARDEFGLEYVDADNTKHSELIGEVKLWLSLEELNNKIRQLEQMVFFVIVLVIIASVAGALSGIELLISKPLKELVAGTEIIGKGDFNHRVKMGRNDEIGSLAESFNSMAGNLSKLVVSKNYVDSIFESMSDILVVFGLNGKIRSVNRATQNILRYSEDELKGKFFDDIFVGKGLFEDGPVISFLKKNAIYSNEERRMEKKSGEEIFVSVSTSYLYDNNGDVDGIICLAKDITEKKRVEAEKHELERRVHVSEKMEALGRLAGGVAHDLNNTLGAIVGYPDLVIKRLPEDCKYQIKALESIKKSGQKAAAIVSDLLTLARRGIQIKEIVSMNNIIEDYCSSPEFEKTSHINVGVDFKKELQNDLLNIQGSPVHLTKTITNLVTNATESIEGTGRVRVTTSNEYIEDNQQRYNLDIKAGEYVCLTVKDNGIGIPEEELEKIFEPFFTKKTMGRSGTGLGMSIVWSTVKDHNGFIEVNSELGKGTEFKLFFPVVRQELKEDNLDESLEELLGNGEKILVIDDMPEQREIASSLLLALRYSVDAVAGSEEAMVYLKEEKVDLVILDMILGTSMDGLDVFHEVMKLYPGIKTVIASGYSETGRVKQALSEGASAYLPKPYTIETIGASIHECFKEKRPHREPLFNED